MEAHIQFIFRPTNPVTKLLAWMIGAPTFGIIRAGHNLDYSVDNMPNGYTSACVLVAKDHVHVEIMALATPVTTAERHAAGRLLTALGLKFGWKRLKNKRFVNRGMLE